MTTDTIWILLIILQQIVCSYPTRNECRTIIVWLRPTYLKLATFKVFNQQAWRIAKLEIIVWQLLQEHGHLVWAKTLLDIKNHPRIM